MKKEVFENILANPGKKHKVSDFDADYTAKIKKEKATELLQQNIERMTCLQDMFYAHNRYSLLLVFQAMDAAGKDGTIKHVMSGLNPQGCQVVAFKQPSSEELDHDYLWRIYKNLPERGRIGIFNRSHYEEVIVTKVHPEILLKQQLPDIADIKHIDKKFWEKRYQQINNFEQHLTDNGTIILKFFLNVSKNEQKKRFLDRLNDDSKNWKFSTADMQERQYWDNYMDAYADMLTNTSTKYAPWHVIPANNKWFMRYVVGQIICDKMEELKIHYPIVDNENKILLDKARKALTKE